MGPERRYPILLSFLKQTLIDLTDESIDLFDVCITSRHKKARKALQDYQAEIVETTEAHRQLLQTIGDVILDNRSPMAICGRAMASALRMAS